MEKNKGIEAFRARTRQQWRKWLERNCEKKEAVYLILFRKAGKAKSVYYLDAIEEALCFGWIDSAKNKRDAESSYQKFSPRRPNSNWSDLNIKRAKRLIKEGQMTEHGLRAIKMAKERGKWVVKKATKQSKKL
ncbi:MAG TPA: hypothetical protein VFU05_07080 [Cyclobacteriaceae bacterium]|nr:hypothetical protein [Cyclobacteriaceae bacterium]